MRGISRWRIQFEPTKHCTTLNLLHYTLHNYTTVLCKILHFASLHYTKLNYTKLGECLQYLQPAGVHLALYRAQWELIHTSVGMITTLWYITLHCTTLRYTTLHYNTLHYTRASVVYLAVYRPSGRLHHWTQYLDAVSYTHLTLPTKRIV